MVAGNDSDMMFAATQLMQLFAANGRAHGLQDKCFFGGRGHRLLNLGTKDCERTIFLQFRASVPFPYGNSSFIF